MRRPPHDGQKPRPRQLKATTVVSPQRSHCTRSRPCSSRPHLRYASNSRRTNAGQPPVPVLRGRAREERREVRRDRPVEHGLLGLAALIGRPGTRDRAHGPAEKHQVRAATAREAHTPMRTRGCPVAPLRRGIQGDRDRIRLDGACRRRGRVRSPPRPASAPERAVLAVPAGVRMEDPRLDRVEDLGDPQFAEVFRIVESVEPTLMDLIDVRDEEKLHGGTMRTPPVISPEGESAGGVVGIDRSAKELDFCVFVDESDDATLRLVGAVLDLQGANSRPAG